MEFGNDLSWFAIQAKPGQEQIAERVVRSMDLETFFPRRRHESFARCAWRREVRPLFPGYLFARFSPIRDLHAVRYSRGVCRVVGAGATPVPVEDEIIIEMRKRLDSDGCVRLETRSWRMGEAVSMLEGPLRGWTGIFERELDDRQRVVILLDGIRQAHVILERDCLESA